MKHIFTFLFIFSFSISITAQEWNKINENDIQAVGKRDIIPEKYIVYNINDNDIKDRLWTSPKELETNIPSSKTVVKLPLADGTFDEFRIVEYRMMDKGFSDKFPNLKTFKGFSINNPYRRVRIDYTLQGTRAMITDSKGKTFIDHYQRGDVETRIVYAKKHFKTKKAFDCGVSDDISRSEESFNRSMIGDCIFREYRLALACTGEYAVFHGGTIPLVASAFVTSINRVNDVYEYDNAVRMVIIANNDLIIFLDGSTDPYTNNNVGQMLGQNQTTCNNIIGNANYDIGHVFGTGGGGVASLGSVCNNNSKARGVTGGSNPVGDPFDIDYVAHEMGHQFGANHTQNNSCNRNSSTAMEPGSASTIMGYAGICSPNVQNNSDDYFHAISVEEIMNEMQSTGHTCETDTITFNNAAPVVTPQPNYTIPKSTYFYLKLTATDADNDPLEYYWDQMDNQVAAMPPQPTNTSGPAFRSIKATPSPIRYFPNINDIVNNTTNTWEVLPSVSRTLNFRGSVKDLHIIGGCNDEEDVTVTVVSSAGPFVVTSQNSAEVWDTGSVETITWDVANTTSSPISANTVDIILSIDGGLTYLDTLAQNVPNDGSHSVIVPGVLATQGRVMVKAHDNIFFDINDTDIVLQSPPFPCYVVTNTNATGPGSFLNALACINANDTIFFNTSVNNDTIDLLNNNAVLDKACFIIANPNQNISITSSSASPTFDITGKFNYTIEGLKIYNTSAEGQVMENLGYTTLRDVQIFQYINSNSEALNNQPRSIIIFEGSTNINQY